MLCEEARVALSLQRYADAGDRELEAHLAGCAACRGHVAANAALDRALDHAPPLLPGPGFDTRFFARLEAERTQRVRQQPRWLRFTWWLLPTAAVAAAALLWARGAPPPAAPQLPPDELALAMDLELVEDLPVVEQLDDLEAYELLSQVDEDELERILAEAE